MTDHVSEKDEGEHRGLRRLIRDKNGGGWLGYRGLFAFIFFTPTLGMFAYWITYTGITLGAGMFYLTLIPFMVALPLTALLPGKSGITPKTLGILAILAVVPYSLYDWARVPMNLVFGIPFWDHWFDWGASILGSTGSNATATGTIFTYEQLTTGLVAHILRGWGLAMAFYLLVRKVTLLSAFVFSWAMTIVYWIVFPVWILTDALPPWIWFFVAWESHMVFALGLWVAPKIFQRLYNRSSELNAIGKGGTSRYKRSWKTTLFGILSSQGFGFMVGSAWFGYVVTSQPPSLYPVFGYGKPPPVLIEGFGPFHWAVVGAVIGVVFLYLTLRSRKASPMAKQDQK
jgi:hypothetical protein